MDTSARDGNRSIVLLGVFAVLILCNVFISCEVGTINELPYLEEGLYRDADLSKGEHIIYLQQIVETAQDLEERRQAVQSLLNFTAFHKTDPYAAYVSYLIAETMESIGENEFAIVYYKKTLGYLNDIIVSGESVKLRAVRRLLDMGVPVEEEVALYQQLLRDFPDSVDQSAIYYKLGYLYEKVANFPASVDSFQKFLSSPGALEPSRLNEVAEIRNRLALYNLNRNWSRKTLDDLVSRVKTAIRNKDIPTVLSLKTQNSFFSMSWLQEKNDFNSVIDFNIERFILGSTSIFFENNLETFSNSQEAYLRSRGWSLQMPVWYLYFRKIDFPADPDFHNTWEWAGVYFGDTLQAPETNRGL